MNGMGIVGSGIAGLQLGLYLQQHGIPAAIYSDRSPEQIRHGRFPNSVARFDHTRERERRLGVHHWELPDWEMRCVHFRINGDPPLTFLGHLSNPAIFVDMRIYQARLLEDFASRGGTVEIGALDASDVERLSERHDLMVVASGRGSLADLFPRWPERSPYAEPQRRLMSGLFRGVSLPEPMGIAFTISPGNGETFQAPFYSFVGRVCNIFIEAIPGGGLEPITALRYDDDPVRFESTLLDLLREHAPPVYERIDRREFGLTRPLDLVQGAITPTVRRGYTQLANGRHVLALGDVHVLNDPVLGQGANTASHSAWVAGDAIAKGGPFDERFCQRVEERVWAYARPVTAWTNAALHAPAPHVLAVFGAAAHDQAIADELIDNFNAPERNWAIFENPASAESFLRAHGHSMPRVAVGHAS
jgi:hypothetical protein